MGKEEHLKVLQHIQFILFDLDGTLLDSREQLVYSAVRTVSHFCEETVHYNEILEKFGSDLTINAKERVDPKIVDDYFIKQKSSDYHNNKIFPHIREGILKMREEGFKLAIVTNQVKELTMDVLEKNELLDFFEVIVTKDDIKSPKPSPEPLNKCMDLLGAQPSNTIMVGDTMADWIAAKEANVECLLLRFYDEDAIGDYSDKMYFFTFNELTEYIVSKKEGIQVD